MGRYAAFLRGINLGNRRVKGPELCAPFVALGFGDVATFLASGNVVFTTDDADTARLTRRIEEALERDLGYPVLTFLRDADEVAAIAARRPFSPADHERSAGKLQVILLPAAPEREAAATALAHATEDDLLELHGRELYWLPSGGMSTSALPVDAIGRAVGPTTIRTANTISRMHAKFFA